MSRTEEIRGCGNHLCKVRKPKGRGTNSCCSCFPHVGGRLDLEAAQLLERVLRHRLEALSRVERLEDVVAAVKEGEEHIQDWDSQDGACNPFWEAWDKACRMAKAVDALEESDGE